VRAGRYSFVVREVKIGRGHHVRAGSLDIPSAPRVQVRVRAGKTAIVAIRYGTIVSANVRRLSRGPISVSGEPTDPSSIVLPASIHVSVGAILTAGPSATLPAGLFHVVTAVRRAGGHEVVELKPAHLTEAFPQLNINSQVSLAPEATPATQARAAEFDPAVVSFSKGDLQCQAPIAAPNFAFKQSVGLDTDVRLFVPTVFGIPAGEPEGKVTLTLSASAALELTLPKDIGCSATHKFKALTGEIPIGPVVLPVYAQVSLGATATIDPNLQLQAGASFAVTAGLEFHGSDAQAISEASGSAQASASGGGKFTGGPTITFAVGVPDFADLHVNLKPALAVSLPIGGPCSIAVEGTAEFGVTIGKVDVNKSSPPLSKTIYTCPPQPPESTQLSIKQSAPPGTFPNQEFAYSLTVTNTGTTTANEVVVDDTVPTEGAFVSSSPAGSSGSVDAIDLGNMAAGESETVTLNWQAPATEATLTNSAVVKATDAPQAGPVTAIVPVGVSGKCEPCGAVSAGTGLRNRDDGTIAISGIPSGATITRAVLVWGVLYDGEQPSNMIHFDGHPVTANVASNVSGTLCWGDTATVGYAADVTSYVTGNGAYDVSEPPQGEIRVDDNPEGVLPYTDGASLIVFYNGGGSDDQVLSNFSYNTNTDPTTDQSITRAFSDIDSVGGPASLTLAGPDGQDAGKVFTFTGDGEITVENPFHGSAPQEGPSFEIGNLWDDEAFEVGSILPAGQQTLTFNTMFTDDCIGISAAVLQVAQDTS
jgi:uncharacterized repeat protein (TIGR01451 family)